MPNDIAALGLAVDSSPVAKATSELQEFAQTAKTAETAAQGFTRGAQQAGSATQAMAVSVAKAVNSAEAINKRLGVRDSFGSAERAADIAAYGEQLDALRAKYNPLFAAEMQHAKTIAEINQAAKVGALSEQERAAAVARTDGVYRASVASINAVNSALSNNTKNLGLSSYALANLSFQLNDVIALAALGAPAFQILASQGGQVYQILASGEGGVTGSVKALTAQLGALITPLRLATAGFIAVGAAAAIAFNDFLAQEREAQLALIGVGSAAGLTSASIRSIATAANVAGQATVGEARTMLLAFAATGKVGDEIAARAIALGRNFQRVFGVDATEAATMLAKALADPGKGVDDLNRRLGAFDARTLQHIKSLQAQNDYYAAQKLLLDGVAQSTKAAEIPVSSLEKAWIKVKEVASEYYALIGRKTDEAFGGGSLESRIIEKQKELDGLINGRSLSNFTNFTRQIQQAGIDRVTRELIALGEKMAQAAEQAELTKQRLESVRIGEIASGVAPANAELQKLRDTLVDLQRALADPKVLAGMSPEQLATLQRAEESTRRRVQFFATGLELARQEQAVALQSIAAQTVAQRAAAEYQAQVTRLRREGDPDAEAKAQMIAQRVLAENAAQVTREQRDQLLIASQRVESTRVELGLVGANAETQERIRAQAQLRQQAEQEALRLYGDREAYDRAHLERLQREAALQAEINAQIRQRTLLQDIQFERAQMGRTAQEQEVYSRLKSAGMLTNGEIKGSAAEAAAAQIRLNHTLRQSIDMSREFASSFVQDMLQGKSATEALANSLNKLASKLADLAVDNAFAALFGGAGGTGSLGRLLGGGINPGGAAQVPTFHSGGIVGVNDNNPPRIVTPAAFAGARRYHTGGIAGLMPGEVPAILQRGEVVLPASGAGRGMGGVSVTMPITIDARGAYPESIAEIKAAVADLNRTLPARAAAAVQQAQDRRIV